VTPASPAEAAVRESARSAFDEAAAEERELGAAPPTPYPAPVAEIAVPPLPPGPVRSTLPGRGKRGPGCGAKKPVGWIAQDGCLPLGLHDCDRRECPRCARPHAVAECPLGIPHGGGEWAHTTAIEVAAKLQGFAATEGFGRDRPLRQVVISPPVDRYDESDDHDRVIARVRRAASKALRKLGWEGRRWASLVVHLYSGCEQEGYARWRPHAHVLCAGVDVRLTEEYHRRTGVVVKQATESGAPGSPFVGYWAKGLVRHLVYELGHAAIVPDGHAVSYLGRGLIAYKPSSSPLEELSDESEPDLRCPHGTPLRALGEGGRPGYDPETREWTYRVDRDRFYRFLDRAPAQGGPLLELVGPSGRPNPVSVVPYLDRRGLPEPHRTWARRKRPPPGGAVPWDPPSDWRPEEP
jgi:hypothetical protein